jgi:RHS repeat-associated protein
MVEAHINSKHPKYQVTDQATTSDGNNALVRSYAWGPDLSGTAQGAGGVGGLLMVNAGSGGVHFPAYDLNGNVMGLVNAANGIISAKYEYGPFGEVFCSVGDMAKVNPFGFSTKYTDNETDLLYYGYRYYSPALGRWLSRDPIEERGGLNLYGFVGNDPVNKWDRLGLQGIILPISGRMPDEKNAWDVGFEWAFGYGPQTNYFGNNYYYTKELRKHNHIKKAKNIIKNKLTFLCMFCENSDIEGVYNYRLGNYNKKERVALMLRDIASAGNDLIPIIKIPLLGEYKLPYNMFNSDISFLGTYDLDYSVDNISCRKGTAHIEFHAFNKTSLESLFRSPITGYDADSHTSIASRLGWLKSRGFVVDKYQDFRWDEVIMFKGNSCCND